MTLPSEGRGQMTLPLEARGQMTLPPEPRGQLNMPESRGDLNLPAESKVQGDLAHWSSHGYLAKEPEQNDSGEMYNYLEANTVSVSLTINVCSLFSVTLFV